MSELHVKIINKSGNPLPAYETPESAGMDVRAHLPNGPVTINPMERALIPTGLRIQLERGYECQVRPRSGLALKHGITVLNTPGTVDADYRGEIGVVLINLGSEPFTVADSDRIAQFVISPFTRVSWTLTERLDHTERGDGAFGHTGLE